MSSSNRPRRRGAVRGRGQEAAVWRPAELAGFDPGPVGREDEGARAATVTAAPDDPASTLPGPDPVELQLQVDNAYARGHEDGRAEGAAEESARLSDALRALERAAGTLEEARPRWLDALEKNLVALSTAIAREVIGRELRGQGDDIAALVHQAVSEFPLDAAVRVRLNPADLSAISSPSRGDALRAGRDVRWVPDPSIATGGCLVEGPESLVDGRVEKALERIYTRLVYHD